MAEQIDFSIVGGGPLAGLMQRAGLADRVLARVVAFAATAWLPLLALSASQGLAVGTSVKIPFLRDCGAYGRLLLAVPILLLAEVVVGWRTREVLRQFLRSELVLEEQIPRFNDAVRGAIRLKEAILPEIIIVGVVYAISVSRMSFALSDPLTTWYHSGRGITPAGWYYALVSLPIFGFLLLRWLWRMALWAFLLWNISRLDLQLQPIHPDRMGGLGFLGLSQITFGLIGFAGGAVVSSYLMNNMLYRGVSLGASAAPMVVYVALAVLVNIAPVLVFTGKLIDTRANGILEYGTIGQEYAKLFDQKWARGLNPEGEVILGTADIQSLADLRNSFDIIQSMSIVPIDRKTALIVAATAAIPMIPLFFVALPFEKILASILGLR